MTLNARLQERIQTEVLELAGSINAMVENFRKLQNPLVDSQEKVPKATQQLDKITEQTEAAAHRMLDIVEKITQREEEVVTGLTRLKTELNGAGLKGHDQSIDTLVEKASTTLNDAYTIMDALQFQDITSQQMNHAAAMLEDIEKKLRLITDVIRGDEEDVVPEVERRKRKQRAYDPHADLFDKKTAQKDIDNLFSKK